MMTRGPAAGYDFENHVIQAGAGITMVYDGDGNRVSKTVAGVAVKYLVDPQNPTGYAQVVQENFSGSTSANHEVSRVFVYGLERISQFRSYILNSASHTQTSYYVYDGHGSARALTDPSGNVIDTYDYDAFGNLLHSTATGTPPGGTTAAPTPNEFLFAGEQFDSDLNLYYNRARYLNVSTGRFWTMDTYEGDPESPLSLHKYLFGQGDPVDLTDPTGHDILEVSFAVGISTVLGGISGATFTGTLKGFFLGAAGGGALGIACSAVELCGRSAVSGVLNLVFQVAANEYESYYDRVLGLPQPSAQKQREALVAAFASGAASPLVSLVVDPNDAARLAALQSAFNAAYKALLQGQTLQQAFVQGLGAAVISYVVQVGVGKDFGPQFYSPPVVDLIISNVRATISSTISTAINPIQEHILRLFPSVHRFVYGN